MKLKLFLRNPSGRGSANVGARYLISDALRERAAVLIKQDKISNPRVYRVGDSVLIWVKVGSERFDKMTYDVLLYAEDGGKTDILNMDMTFFSNSPSFTFTYAFAFNNDEDLAPIATVANLVSKRSITEAPVERNPQKLKGFEKSIFYAVFSLIDKGDNIVVNLDDYVIREVTEVKHVILDFNKNGMSTAVEKLAEYNKRKQADRNSIAKQRQAGIKKRKAKLRATRKRRTVK